MPTQVDLRPQSETPSAPDAPVLSPGLATRSLGAAYELKFRLTPAEAAFVEAWARKHLKPDHHGAGGSYRVASVYCDTPALDVFRRSAGFKKRKYRVRRYGDSPDLFLERKTKVGDQVRKKRVTIGTHETDRLSAALVEAEWSGAWFHARIQKRNLGPVCLVSYQRTAFFGMAGDAPIRLTLDHNVAGEPTRGWHVRPTGGGVPIVDGDFLCELKYHVHMPTLFQDLLPHLPAQPARVSKYRRCVELCGLAERIVAASDPSADPSTETPPDGTPIILPGPHALRFAT